MTVRDPVDTIGNTTERVIAPNVWEFINKASALYGRMHEERFSQNMYGYLTEGPLESPIEDLFFVAFQIMCAGYYEPLNPDPDLVDGQDHAVGIWLSPQRVIGSYRVDFLVTRSVLRWQGEKGVRVPLQPVVIELDGHDFHERDKQQRSYEKARDRELVRRGCRVLHFTGSDVVRDPLKVAFEVLQLLGVTGNDEYVSENPLGID